MECLQEAVLGTGSGIAGDYHTNVSLLTKAAQSWMERQEMPGLCFGKLKANLLLNGVLVRGGLLSFSDVILRIHTAPKYCFAACVHKQTHVPCPLAEGMFFADVLRGGSVHVGELGTP